ncbi:hypothetical protein NEMBOFW57_004555 [Staphylotrichum longicolle]|uniref:F-box domain-containing protein n=1 Tax=Staphylotrichum longicolle TaxID=669026 RepID=A0AAD4I483_9PEZI|nr:hypothetical protein NEMBOFW57_004555 [Staphylotrichum longicolle]
MMTTMNTTTAKPSSPYLLRLPPAALAGIAEALCPHCTEDPAFSPWVSPIHGGGGRALLANTHALASLAATCRVLYDIVCPILYHQPQCLPEQRLSLLRTLDSRPELARRVKVLRLDLALGYQIKDDDDRAFVLDLAVEYGWTSEDQEMLDIHEGWRTGYNGVDQDHPSNLLIAMCRNLEKFSMAIGNGSYFMFLDSTTLRRLKDVYVTHSDTEMGTHLASLQDLFLAAPRLETFTSNMTSGAGDEDLYLKNLLHLRLTWSSISAECLRTLLRSCPRLESFSYEAGGVTVGDEQFGPKILRRLLARYAPQLKRLDINLLYGYNMSNWNHRREDEEGGDDGGPEPAPPFAALSHLETLVIEPRLLNDWDGQQPLATLFPQSLRSLTVWHRGPGDKLGVDDLKAFASTARTLLPNLTVLNVYDAQ